MRSSMIVSAVVAILPLSIAVIPWGILTGAMAIQAGFSPLQSQCLSLLVFAGAAQISGISMVAAGVPAGSILGSTMIISSRHLLYSVVFREYVEKLSFIKRAAVAFVLTDEMFVVSEADTRKNGHFSLAFALISGFTFYVIWNIATLLGIVVGTQLEGLESLGLDFAIVATFIAMTFDQLKSKPDVAAVVISGVLAVVLKPYFAESYIVIAAVTGMMVAFVLGESAVQEVQG